MRQIYAIAAGYGVKVGRSGEPSSRLQDVLVFHHDARLVFRAPISRAGMECVRQRIEPHRIRGDWYRPTALAFLSEAAA